MKRAVMVLLVAASGCDDLDPAVLYRCESSGVCLQSGFVCWSDGYCRAVAEPVDSGSGGGGGSIGGGGGSIGGGGGSIGGGGGGGSAGGGGGSACTACPATFCGYFDAGCGETYCGGCTAGTECGVARQNRCDTPRLCTQEGWCFENPLPQGNTIRAAFVAGPREVYFVGDNATALLWNGEHHSIIPLPGVGEGVDFLGVHGTSPQDIIIVGSQGTILHYDGTSWVQEPLAFPSTPQLRAVWARTTKPSVAVGKNNNILRRTDAGGWNDDALTDGPIDLNDVAEGPDGRLYALGTYSFAQPRAGLMREGDAGAALTLWDRASRPPLIRGNSVWVSPDGGFFIAGVADAGAGLGRVGLVLRRGADAGWEEVARVPDELKVVRGFTSDDFFAAGENGVFLQVIDGGTRVARLGKSWNALAPLALGPMVEGRAGQVARLSMADGGLEAISSGSDLNINGLCGYTSADLLAASQGTPNCTGGACAPLSLERTPTGRWNPVSHVLPDSSEFVACANFVGFKWLLGDDTPFLSFHVTNMTWTVNDPRTTVPRTRNSRMWIESGVSGWITNGTPPAPSALPHVTRLVGTPLNQVPLAVFYDGGGDLITTMGGENRAWALGQRGLAFTLASDGGLEPAPRIGTDDFTSIASGRLRDGGALVIAAGLNGALYREDGAAGFVSEGPLDGELLSAWVTDRGDAFVVGGDIPDGGRRQARVFQRVGSSWVNLPIRSDQPLKAVWSGPLADAGQGVWVGGPDGLILRRAP
ncbi:MAG: hypothetical protein Q8N23_10465 [Archangium sp.]|nr:hypothetical protein [Archangium sp.]